MPVNSNVLQVIINGKNNAGPALQSLTRQFATFQAVSTAALTAAALRAGKFEEQMAEISTLLDGDVTPAVNRMRKEILDLSVEFGQTAGKMAKARYDIISAGFTDAADSARVLTAANKLAVAGVSDVAKTADLLTTAINGMGLEAADSARVSDVLFQIVRSGKTTMDELAASMGPVFASARVARVSLEELGGVMATTTAAGIDTRESATALSQLLLALAAPSGEAKDALEALGITLDNGLGPALASLASVSEDGLDALSKLIPNIRALKAAGAAAADVDKLNANIQAMVDSSGAADTAVAKMSETFAFQMRQAKAAVDALVIELGTALIPTFKSATAQLRDAAVLVRFLAGTTEDGTALWKEYARALLDDIAPALDAIREPLKWAKDRLDEMNEGLKRGEVNKAVTAIMQDLMKLEDTPFLEKGLFGEDIWDFAGLRQYATLIYEAQQAAEPKETVFDRVNGTLDDLKGKLAEFRAQMEAARRAAVDASDIVQTGFGGPAAPGGPLGPEAPEGLAAERKKAADEERKADENRAQRIEELKAQMADLAKFTAQDFVDMAYSVSDSFGVVAGDIGAKMLGLSQGPIMVGRAFKSMAAGIISDLARIGARILATKALMAAFGGGLFGGFGALLGFASGGVIPRAASGMAVPGGGAVPMPAMVIPGSPGLDRTPVLAHGGEVMVSRQAVDAIDRSRRRARTEPPAPRRTRQRPAANYQIVRPFRREEQTLLWDSTSQAEARATRYRG